jgi:hypothetical protein
MLYDSTKKLLHDILTSLAADSTGWEDRIESTNECLYEMHQMSRGLHKAYRDAVPSTAPRASNTARLGRAIPHVKAMMSAMQQRDTPKAVESGRAALAEL